MFLNFKHYSIVYNDNLGEINLADYYINSISVEVTFESYNLVLTNDILKIDIKDLSNINEDSFLFIIDFMKTITCNKNEIEMLKIEIYNNYNNTMKYKELNERMEKLDMINSSLFNAFKDKFHFSFETDFENFITLYIKSEK
jgi:hypothetical protein